VVQTNAGVAAARNTGFAHIGALPYVCFLDSDDVWGDDFLGETLRALERRNDLVAAVSNRIEEVAGKAKPVQNLQSISLNPLLWLICNSGGILSCTLIRSAAARAAGLFIPGMVVSEDTDFLIRLFSLGGVAHSKASPVVCTKMAVVDSAEPQNLSYPASPELRYLWAQHLTGTVAQLPKPFFKEHEHLIRSAVAQRWAAIAFLKRRNAWLALKCLLQAIWWDDDWARRRYLVWSFLRGRRKLVLHCFDEPLSSYSPLKNPVSGSC
jgi:cellulose synthase/poly-beta-1,6-N-acetylglucosamine synthase-like glycosyltransferase